MSGTGHSALVISQQPVKQSNTPDAQRSGDKGQRESEAEAHIDVSLVYCQRLERSSVSEGGLGNSLSLSRQRLHADGPGHGRVPGALDVGPPE